MPPLLNGAVQDIENMQNNKLFYRCFFDQVAEKEFICQQREKLLIFFASMTTVMSTENLPYPYFPWQLYPHDKCIFWYHSASFCFISAQKMPYGPFPSPHLSQHANITYNCKKCPFCLFRGVVYWNVWVGQCLSLSSISINVFCVHSPGHSVKAPVGRWQKGKDLHW